MPGPDYMLELKARTHYVRGDIQLGPSNGVALFFSGAQADPLCHAGPGGAEKTYHGAPSAPPPSAEEAVKKGRYKPEKLVMHQDTSEI